MKKIEHLGTRILIALGAGHLVAVIVLLTAWQQIGGMPDVRSEQLETRHVLEQISYQMKEYRRRHGTLPQSLSEAVSVYSSHPEPDPPVDGWGRPLIYSVDGEDYTVTSLGRDGKPGGAGLDYDMSISDAGAGLRTDRLTLRQFLWDAPTTGIIWTCVVAGVVVFFISLSTVDPAAFHGRGLVTSIINLILTIGGTAMAAFFMTTLHIPNHH